MASIVVRHVYNDETECGHVVEVDGERVSRLKFDHPYGAEHHKEFVEAMVRRELGFEYLMDIDWDNCEISDD